jgi:hypothetical protein
MRVSADRNQTKAAVMRAEKRARSTARQREGGWGLVSFPGSEKVCSRVYELAVGLDPSRSSRKPACAWTQNSDAQSSRKTDAVRRRHQAHVSRVDRTREDFPIRTN